MSIPRLAVPFFVLAFTPFFLSCGYNSASIEGVVDVPAQALHRHRFPAAEK